MGAIKNLYIIIAAAPFQLQISEDHSHTVVVWDLDVPQTSGIIRIIPRVEWARKLPRGLGQETSTSIVYIGRTCSPPTWTGRSHLRECTDDSCILRMATVMDKPARMMTVPQVRLIPRARHIIQDNEP